MPAPRTIHEDRTLRIATCDNLLLALWWDAPEIGQMHTFRDALRKLSREQTAGSALLNVVLKGTPHFTDAVRAEALRLAKEPSLYRLGAAHVILLGGMAGVATRAFLSTLLLMAKGAAPMRIFGEPSAAAEWLADRMAQGSARGLGRADILGAFEQTSSGR